MNGFIDDFAIELVESGLSSKSGISGCTDVEIRELENHFDIDLPNVYKDFLTKMGKGAGRFFDGTDVFYSRLIENQNALEAVLALDKNPFSLTKETFIFLSHQGYIFYFFDTLPKSDDPPVYGYREGELKTRLIANSFSRFLQDSLAEEVEGAKV